MFREPQGACTCSSVPKWFRDALMHRVCAPGCTLLSSHSQKVFCRGPEQQEILPTVSHLLCKPGQIPKNLLETSFQPSSSCDVGLTPDAENSCLVCQIRVDLLCPCRFDVLPLREHPPGKVAWPCPCLPGVPLDFSSTHPSLLVPPPKPNPVS